MHNFLQAIFRIRFIVFHTIDHISWNCQKKWFNCFFFPHLCVTHTAISLIENNMQKETNRRNNNSCRGGGGDLTHWPHQHFHRTPAVATTQFISLAIFRIIHRKYMAIFVVALLIFKKEKRFSQQQHHRTICQPLARTVVKILLLHNPQFILYTKHIYKLCVLGN